MGNSPRAVNIPLTMKVGSSQPEIKDSRGCVTEGASNIYEMNVTARIPTVFEGGYFMYKFLGHSSEPFLVSPDGYIAQKSYYKNVAQLLVDKGDSGGFKGVGNKRAKETEEDTLRFELLENKEVIDELKSMGWMYFPESQEVNEHQLKAAGINKGYNSFYCRTFELPSFIKMMKLINHRSPCEVNLDRAIPDLEEVLPYATNGRAAFVWETGHSAITSPFFLIPAKRGERDFHLVLRDYDDIFREGEPNTMRREAIVRACPIVPDLDTLVDDYAKVMGIHTHSLIANKDELVWGVKDRDSSVDRVEKADTGKLLDQVFALSHFSNKVIQSERREVEESERARLDTKRAKYGISVSTIL